MNGKEKTNNQNQTISGNKIQQKTIVSEEEKKNIQSGQIYHDPSNNTLYSIEWPIPSQMSILIIKKPGEKDIEEYAEKIIK